MAFVGRVLRSQVVSKDVVNASMIRHWAEAMGDTSAVHTDDEVARAHGREGIVAPATMVQAWPMAGYAAALPGARADPALVGADELVACLERHGYSSVVATNSDFEFVRELVPGELVVLTEVVESISAEKKTGLGLGRFVTSMKTYCDEQGKVVATQRWRTLRFKPPVNTADSEPANKAVAARPRPAFNSDNEFWFRAASERRLVIQRCSECLSLRHPPGPCCPECNSFSWDEVESTGRGTVYSFVITHHPPHPGFDLPLLVALVELDEGARMVANLVGVEHDQVSIGMPVTIDWLEADPELTLPVFRLFEQDN
ncbi:bifunctional MaoC family dehydratase N-terminal/OB-fold nucleic acid binding domain-containing protein [Rhodococcus globerulus]|uniref:bifunctional MaoC family dehydratase N-terminal/OB-fold nucleic acid binding domain-containing protein n=1 Tax=Rhodococcus globerulus TaxID=33008 RepID=UPI003AFA1403